MRRTPLVLVAICATVLTSVAACGDDDASSADATAGASAQISTEGVCAVLEPARASEVMGVEFDDAEAGAGSCTYTATASRTAFTLQVTQLGSSSPADALDRLDASCDPDTRQERTFSGADGGFSCLVGGVSTVVALGGGVVLVLTASSEAAGATAERVADHLATLLEDAIVGYGAG